MDHGGVSLYLRSTSYAPELPGRKAELSGSLGGRKKSIVHFSQNGQTIAISKTQCQHLLPRPNQVESKVARRRTFLFQRKRTFLFQCYTGYPSFACKSERFWRYFSVAQKSKRDQTMKADIHP